MKNDFENLNFDMFEEVALNFGKHDSDISYDKNAQFHQMHMWFHAQLKQKNF